MLRHTFYIFIITILLLIWLIPAQAGAREVNIVFNGKDVTQDFNPIIYGGQLLIKSRSLAEYTGSTVKWYKPIKTLTMSLNGVTVKLMVNNPYIQVNNRTIKVDNGMLLREGQTYVPVQVVSGFGYLINQEGDTWYIYKPESYIKGITWLKEGQQLLIDMDKITPYRVIKSDDPRQLIIEIDKAMLSKNFKDSLSNENFYLKINKAVNRARLQLVVSSKYPIPFKLDGGVEETDSGILIKFLPHIKSVKWEKERLVIKSTGSIKKPEISLLSNPRRLVLDIPDMMQSDFDIDLPINKWVSDIEVSQYSYDPIILRVVVVLKKGSYLNLKTDSQGNQLVLVPGQITKVADLKCVDNRIEFTTNRKIKPDIFILQNPDRLVVDLINSVRDKDFPEKINVQNGLIKRIRSARFNEETVRIVADLLEYTGYTWNQVKETNNRYQHMIILNNKIEKIKLDNTKKFTDISIFLSGKVNYEIKEFFYPNRLVVDARGIVNNLDEEDLPTSSPLIKDIRLSQFSKEPRIARFVFELGKRYEYEVLSPTPSHVIKVRLKKEEKKELTNIIAIDAGHGGFDPGALGVTGLKEKIVTLDIARKVKTLLEDEGYRVLMTRTDDTFISLKDRVKKANDARARIFVSIHANAFNESYSEGIETYISPDKTGNSLLLAQNLQEQLVRELKLENRGVKQEELYVLNHSSMPAALVEVGFLSNPHEETLLRSELFRKRVARALYRGILNYIKKIEQGDGNTHDK
ncbi:N-acetylmuramoyl-L-alanine amidase [Halothermothrix orenii]|uniref:N-acetylmuramoyl-L-alanine amidase n=1 Tax=Halothermothrix orenii (strain H 168 / OCM 544 / DSM 9562) TaxID=373903 RepID=B8CYD1_HALOH|nr:N-acetylmuramoyl-L-alanine amidase [Halothermothrix orenii]ACL70300.1 N-acetylmuramoyl-L-alanine amidase [Halothermothrix orenii H 168]